MGDKYLRRGILIEIMKPKTKDMILSTLGIVGIVLAIIGISLLLYKVVLTF